MNKKRSRLCNEEKALSGSLSKSENPFPQRETVRKEYMSKTDESNTRGGRKAQLQCRRSEKGQPVPPPSVRREWGKRIVKKKEITEALGGGGKKHLRTT